MGSWYQTCFVSHLPIVGGEKCRLFFLEPTDGWKGQRVSSGFSSIHDMWAPCSFGLLGEWDEDEAEVVGIDDTSLEVRLLLKHVQRKLIEIPEPDEHGNPPVLRAEVTLHTLQENICHGRARFIDFKGREQPYGCVVVREDVRKAILRKGWSEDWRTPKRFTVNRLIKQGEALVAALRVRHAEKQLETESWKRIMIPWDIEGATYEGKDIEYDIPRYIPNSLTGFRDYIPNNLLEMVVQDSPDIPRFLRLVATHYMFVSYLELLRRAWMPQPGRGSQGMDYAEHAWFATLVGDIARWRDGASDD